MKITKVQLYPKASLNTRTLAFRDPNRSSPYNIVSATGLDVDSILPQFYGVSKYPSTKFPQPTSFYNLRLNKREVVFRIQLNPDYSSNETYSDLRDDLYKMISSSRTGLVDIQFVNVSTVVAVISGWITKFECDLFQKDPEAIITIVCDDPMLRDPVAVDVDVSPLNFNWSSTPNESQNLKDDVSTAPHGFTLIGHVITAITIFALNNVGDDSWEFHSVYDVGGDKFQVGDYIHLSTDYNKNEFYLTRGASRIDLADKITPGSTWPIMFPGNNYFWMTGVSQIDLVSIQYYKTYWGI